MSYSNQQVEELYEQLIQSAKNILIGRTNGGTVGETVFVTLSKPFNGQTMISGVTIQDCPPGECVALSDGIAWYVVSNNGNEIKNEAIIRLRKSRGLESALPQHKMAILYTSRSEETHKCTCPRFSGNDGKCKESCTSGDYSTLEECQLGSERWTVYMSAGSCNWHQVKYVSHHNPAIKATFYMFPNDLNVPRFGSVIYDIPYYFRLDPPTDNAGKFLYRLTGVSPDFSVSCTFVGRIKWYGTKDLEAVNYSAYIDMWRRRHPDYKDTEDPYSLYRRLTRLHVLGPYAYRYYNNIDDAYPLGYYQPQLSSYADGPSGNPNAIGMMISVEPKNVARGLDFFNTILSSRLDLDGESLKIDYVLDKYRNVIKDYNSPPPPPPYAPPDAGKLYFVLGGDKSKPLKLPFELSDQDPYAVSLSVVKGRKIVTVRHGKERDKKNEERWCKITTLVVSSKNKVKKTTTSAPGPVPPIAKEWRSHLIYDFKPREPRLTELEMKCSYNFWSSQTTNIASNLNAYPWDGTKAQLYKFNSADAATKGFLSKILEKNQNMPLTTISAKWKLNPDFCGIKEVVEKNELKVFRLLTHDNQKLSSTSNLVNILAFAIYRSN